MARKPIQNGIVVPVVADTLEAPVIIYKSGFVALDFLSADGVTWWRVSFESLDALRVSKGEFEPYLSGQVNQEPNRWVSIVKDAPWLLERCEYDHEWYGGISNWSETVIEMVREFDHYVFTFHDEYVEVIARGFWIDELEGWTPEQVPFSDLSETAHVEKCQVHGISYEIRTNPKPMGELIEKSSFCSQNLFQFAVEIGGVFSVDWSVKLRTREGKLGSSLRNQFGGTEEIYKGVVTVDQVLPQIEKWIGIIASRD
jgi:hypothetical protein